MNERNLQNAAEGFTQSRKGNKFYFESPFPGMHIYSNIWENSQEFLDKLETEEFWKTTPRSKEWIREDFYDEEVGKRASTCWVRNSPEIQDAFQEVVDSYLSHWNLDPKIWEDVRITKYTPGEYFGAHPDDSFGTPRTVSMVYYPNDDYEGGELEFIHFGVTIKPKAHQLFVFPSGYSYEHKIHKIGQGSQRYTMVSFFNNMTAQEKQKRMEGLPFPYQTQIQYMFEDKHD
jgi:Rps23 Pro-64 3,4-dihydroxylase Tpa1-like proline 4-hydroxylase